jgi:hypothetical protein
MRALERADAQCCLSSVKKVRAGGNTSRRWQAALSTVTTCPRNSSELPGHLHYQVKHNRFRRHLRLGNLGSS